MPDPTNGALGVTYTITGLAWPETIGNLTLMGPANSLGSWRWYQQRFETNGAHVTDGKVWVYMGTGWTEGELLRIERGAAVRIKLDSQLQPIWESLRTIPNLQHSVPQKADNRVD